MELVVTRLRGKGARIQLFGRKVSLIENFAKKLRQPVALLIGQTLGVPTCYAVYPQTSVTSESL